MSSGIFTKEEIVEKLSQEGYFVDLLTLSDFIKDFKIQAIFEDKDGNELFDKTALEIITSKLAPSKGENVSAGEKELEAQELFKQKKGELENIDWKSWNEVSSDLLPLKNAQKEENKEADAQQAQNDADVKEENSEPQLPQETQEEDFDDMELLSDSFQAQEKFKNYVISQLEKKNPEFSAQNVENAFKLDISEKTISMVAKALAKKIAQQVSLLLVSEQSNNTKLIEAQNHNKELENKISALEDENKKLKILLLESNKNLNSYKPTLFGLYKFVKRKAKKKK